MKLVYIFIVCFIISNKTFSQTKELTIEEAVDYLQSVLNFDLEKQNNIYGGIKSIRIESFENEIQIDYSWSEYKDAINYNYNDTEIDYNRIVFNVNKVNTIFLKKYNTKYTVAVQCTDSTKNCFYVHENAIKSNYAFEFVDSPKATNHFDYLHLFYLKNKANQIKAYNALAYAINKLKNKKNEFELIDPFVKESNTKKEVIHLTKEGSVFSIYTNLGGISSVMLLDSGSSDVSIPEHFVTKLLSKKIITQKDFLTSGLYSIADGSVVENRRFIIPYIKVDNVVVKNIRCSANKSEDVFLLGKSFLDRFKSWKINNQTSQLILEF